MKEINKLEDTKPKFPYEEILYKEYIPSKKHPRMPKEERASQFSPFQALTGYEDAIKETSRLTENEIYLTDDEKIILDEKLTKIENNIEQKVEITYFIKDKYKTGGLYKNIKDTIKKIDKYNKLIIMNNNEKIKVDNIVNIDFVD